MTRNATLWTVVILAVVLVGVGASVPFTQTGKEARKAAQRIDTIDGFLSRMQDDQVVMDGRVVPRTEAEERIRSIRSNGLMVGMGATGAFMPKVFTRNDLLNARQLSQADAEKWERILSGSAAAIVLGLGVALLALVRRPGARAAVERSVNN